MSSPDTPVAVLVAVATAVMLVLLHRRSTVASKRPRLPPGPATLPLIGNMHQMIWNKPSVSRWINGLLNCMGTDILCLRFGSVHVVVVACPEMAWEVLRVKEAAFMSRPSTFVSSAFSYGYKSASLTTLEQQWRKMRRIITSEILSPALDRRLHAQRVKEADHLVRYFYNQIKMKQDNTINVRYVGQHFCGNLVRRLVFGRRYFGEVVPAMAVGGPRDDEVEHVNALFTLVNYVYGFCVSDYFRALVGLDLDGHEKVAKGVVSTFYRLHDPIIEERMQEWADLREASEKREATDFLDVLVSLEDVAGHPLLTFEEIKAEGSSRRPERGE